MNPNNHMDRVMASSFWRRRVEGSQGSTADSSLGRSFDSTNLKKNSSASSSPHPAGYDRFSILNYTKSEKWFRFYLKRKVSACTYFLYSRQGDQLQNGMKLNADYSKPMEGDGLMQDAFTPRRAASFAMPASHLSGENVHRDLDAGMKPIMRRLSAKAELLSGQSFKIFSEPCARPARTLADHK